MAYKQRSPIIVSEGGTGATSLTNNGVILGQDTAALTAIAVGDTGELLVGATGAPPSFSNLAYGNFTFSNLTPATSSTLAVTNGDGDVTSNATMFIGTPDGGGDPCVNWQVSGTTNYASGIDNSVAGDPWKLTNSSDPSSGDALIAITNAGVVSLFNALDVSEGGTGVVTLTSHGILLGNGAGDIQALAEATDGQLAIGSTGANPVLATLTAGAGIGIANAAGSITISATGSGVDEDQIYYVGKHGNDGDSGRSIEEAVLTFGQAITLAAAQTPSAINRFAIVCFDDGIYAENITVPQYVDVFAPSATLTGTIICNDDSTIKYERINVATGTTGISKTAGSVYTNIDIDYIECAGTAIGCLCVSGFVNFSWKVMYVEDGFGVGDLSSAAAHMHVKGGDIYITGTGVAVARANTGSILGRIDHIVDTGAGSGTAIEVLDGTVDINVSSIACNVAYNLNGATAVMRLFCNEISGTRTVAGGATAKLWVPPTAMTNGQLVIGSTGVDPVVASLISTGATIGITGGAGSIDLDVAAAVPTSFLADDANSAIPAANVLTVAGGNNISTTAAASTLTISLTDTTQYALQVGDATGSLDSLAVGTANQILQSGGAGANPAWSTATYPATTSQGDVLYSSSDNTIASLAKDATATRYLANTGAGNNPAWDQVELTDGVSGILPVTNGGTGVADPTDHSLLVGSGAAAMTELGVATNGQLVIGSTGADPVLATLTAGSGISITNAAGSVTVATSGGGMAWEEVTDATKSMVINTAYGANRGGGVTFTLPATAAIGTRLEIVGIAGNWALAQNAGQTVYIGDDNTTAGVGGSLTATDAGDCIQLVCIVTDTDFRVKSMMGNVTTS